MKNPPAKLGLGINACRVAWFVSGLLAAGVASSQSTAESPWTASAQLGVGYDTNANGSTREQTFLGFTLDPRRVATESSFGELALSAEHTAEFEGTRGFISTFQLAHRAYPDAPVADQTVAALGTEAVLVRNGTRWSTALSGYANRLDSVNHEHGANIDLAVSHRSAGHLETAFTLRTSRVGFSEKEFEVLDIDRYLAGLSFSQVEIGEGANNIGITFLAGRDAARRGGSPFGDTRWGALISGTWLVRPRRSAYLEVSAQRSDYAGEFFGFARRDGQYEAVVSLEFQSWPAVKWSLTPQLRYVRNDSTVSVFAYDRVEAALYIARQF